jgi:hypothetical protein
MRPEASLVLLPFDRFSHPPQNVLPASPQEDHNGRDSFVHLPRSLAVVGRRLTPTKKTLLRQKNKHGKDAERTLFQKLLYKYLEE